MASYRPFPPQSSFGLPSQNPLPPPLVPPPPRPNQYSQNRIFSNSAAGSQPSGPPPPPPPPSYPPNYNQTNPNSSFHYSEYGSSSSHHYRPTRGGGQPPLHHQQQPQSSYQPQPPPPMPSASMNPQLQPLPHPMYYPSSQYPPQYNHHSVPPPPPPMAPSSPPPPGLPTPSSGPLPNQGKESGPNNHGQEKGVATRDSNGVGWRELGHLKHGLPSKQQEKVFVPPPLPVPGAGNKPNGNVGRVETEEERRLRKKREYEKLRMGEKHRQKLKESQNTVLHKTQMMSSEMKGHGSIMGSRMGEWKTNPFLSGERIENRLKKPTTFLCKLKFRNELPDPAAQPKLLSLNTNKDQYTKYTITSLEKIHKPKLFVEPDLGIPLDLLDISVYNPLSIRPPLAPEDEKLLHDDESVTPVKQDGIRRKERPTDKGVSWLVKTQYISPLSTDAAKQSLTEKQAKELRETRGSRNLLENLNSREKKIQAIEASFEACKSVPVHATNESLRPVEILPLLPDFDRYEDQFVLAAFDSDPTADSEVYNKLDRSARDIHESQAIMKSFAGGGSDPAKPEKFLAYMVPSPDELSKDLYDESEDISYTWVREYHWDVRGGDAGDPTTYLVTFDEDVACYLPLPTKLVLRKRRAKEGRSNDEVEHYPVPSRVTARRRSAVAAIELGDSGGYASSKDDISRSKRERSSVEDGLEMRRKVARVEDMEHSSGAEDDMSE